MIAPTMSAANENHDARATPRAAVSAAWRASASACGLDASAVADATALCACCLSEPMSTPLVADGAAAAPTVAVVEATLPATLTALPTSDVAPYATSKIMTAHASNPWSQPSTGAQRPAK